MEGLVKRPTFFVDEFKNPEEKGLVRLQKLLKARAPKPGSFWNFPTVCFQEISVQTLLTCEVAVSREDKAVPSQLQQLTKTEEPRG